MGVKHVFFVMEIKRGSGKKCGATVKISTQSVLTGEARTIEAVVSTWAGVAKGF
jgi:hypothetical protein